jgi:hypothetical protein
MKTTKRQTTQTLQEKLSEIDWDLLEELDQQEEGQSVPMQDLPDSQSKAMASSQEPALRQTIPLQAVNKNLLKPED